MMAKLNFQQSLPQSSVSHDPSEIILICWFGAQETFFVVLFNIFLWKLCFFKDFQMNRHLFEIEIFCNIINVFIVI